MNETLSDDITLTLTMGDATAIASHLSCLADLIDGEDDRYRLAGLVLTLSQRQVLTDPAASGITTHADEFGAHIREMGRRIEAQLPDSAPIIRPSKARPAHH